MTSENIPSARIVIIDDEPDIRSTLTGVLQDEDYEVFSAENVAAGLDLVADKSPDVCFLDVWLPDADGVEALPKFRTRSPSTQFIMISGHSTIEAAVRATSLGAVDFLEKPLGLEKVLLAVQNALKMRRLTVENENLRGRFESRYQLIGESNAMQRVREQVDRVARTQATVLITGENGTGKENVSRAIHLGSTRKSAPFVALNCAAIPEELIESEMFGHEKGAFTGAHSAHRGKFELAHRGTLFLDEVGDMSLKTQSKLLRVLQDQRFERVGGARSISVDVRVVAATNKDLRAEIAAGRFREDLYYRLNVIPIELPPLRERGHDIVLLARHFLGEYCLENSTSMKTIAPSAEAVLLVHSWPGNVRELKNLMERLSILASGPVVVDKDLKHCGLATVESLPASCDEIFLENDFRSARNRFEKEFILKKLEMCGSNVSRTAELIGMERSHLHRKMRQLGIESEERELQAPGRQ